MTEATRTLRLKVRAESYAWLDAAAREVNTVWNWANATSMDAADRTRRSNPKWLTGFALCSLSAGASEYFERIGSDTIQRICCEYALKRRAAQRFRLRWRASKGARRALGWVPFKAASLKRKGVRLRFAGKHFRVFERDRLEDVKWRDGCFAQDAVGDWWLCLPVTVSIEQTAPERDAVGIDLGCKDAAVSSDGDRLASGRYRSMEPRIAQAQRRGHKRQAKRLHRTAANQRRDALHKFSTMLVREYGRIYVGDVSSTRLAQTHMAKGVFDAGWGMLKTQLQYKCQSAGREFAVVSERNTTRPCSGCGALTGPAGLGMLAVRHWECADCGESHDRDVNAARNIRSVGSRCMTSVCGNEPHRRARRRAGHLARARQGKRAQAVAA